VMCHFPPKNGKFCLIYWYFVVLSDFILGHYSYQNYGGGPMKAH
jgi:hypothetical protein